MIRFASLVAALAVAVPAAAQDAGGPPPPPPAPTAETTVPAAEWRTIPAENLLVIDTTKGRVLIELAPEAAPLHVERIKLLARKGFFDGLTWHRVIDWFMAQTGDPLGTGDGQSIYPDLKGEFTFRRDPSMSFTPVAAPMGAQVGFLHSLPIQTQSDAAFGLSSDGKAYGWGLYCPGVAGMARDTGEDTANSQFFIMRQAYPPLDKRYTVWGMTVSGLDVVRSLQVGDGDNGMMAQATPDRMTRVRVAADLPEGERPTVRMLDTASPRFAALVEQTRAARGADFSVCDVTAPVEVAG
jgi:peptidylprolyl isomerase